MYLLNVSIIPFDLFYLRKLINFSASSIIVHSRQGDTKNTLFSLEEEDFSADKQSEP